MQVHDEEGVKKVDVRVVTLQEVENKLSAFLTYDDEDSSNYIQFIQLRASSVKNLILFAFYHIVFIILWFGRNSIFNSEYFGQPFSKPQGSNLVQLLDSLAVITCVSALIILLSRIRACVYPSLRANEIDSSRLLSLSIDGIYVICFSIFLSLQALVQAQLGNTPDGGLLGDTVLIAFLTPVAVRFIFGDNSSRALSVLSWAASFIVIIITITLYSLSESMALVPMQYALTALYLYHAERRSRRMYLMRGLGRTVMKKLTDEEEANSVSVQLSRELRDIIAYTAYDMKSPCNALQLGLDAFKSIAEGDYESYSRESGPLLHNLDSTLAFMVMTNNRSMDFAKIHKGHNLVPSFEVLDIGVQLDWAIGCVNWNGEIAVKLAETSAGKGLSGMTEKSWLRDNLLCVIGNAVKYTPDGEVVIVEAVTKGVAGRELIEIRIIDGGVPLSDRKYAHLFDKPTQITRREVGGRGLGLFCLAERVSVLKGAFGAERRRDSKNGSVIWFRVPFNDISRQAASRTDGKARGKNSRQMKKEREKADKKKKELLAAAAPTFDPNQETKPLETVLVIDDSLPVLKMTAMVFEKAGVKVDKAKNGKLGLDLMKEKVYDLVVMDVQMPEMSGLEATALLREFEKEAGPDRPHQLVVGVSANNEGVMKTECLQAGMDFFTIKPFSLDQIMLYYKGSQGAQLPKSD